MVSAERIARAEQLAPYFEAQLRFAQRMAELTGSSLGDMAFQHTNLNRRFGLGFAGIVPPSEAWLDYAARLEAEADLSGQLRLTVAMFEASPEELAPLPHQRGFGCFAYDPPKDDGVVRIHFFNFDTDNQGGPLASSKLGRRRAELAAMIADIRARHSDVRTIRGASWLYNLEAYRRIFPPDYGASRQLMGGPVHLTGTSSWGQLIDSRGAIRSAVRDALLANLAELDPREPWTAFPHRVLGVSAPIETFVRF